jgi:hypothetical protein
MGFGTCLLDAIAGHGRASYDFDAADRLGITLRQAKCLEGGFEGWSHKEWLEPELYALGQKLRTEQLAKGGRS